MNVYILTKIDGMEEYDEFLFAPAVFATREAAQEAAAEEVDEQAKGWNKGPVEEDSGEDPMDPIVLEWMVGDHDARPMWQVFVEEFETWYRVTECKVHN